MLNEINGWLAQIFTLIFYSVSIVTGIFALLVMLEKIFRVLCGK